MFILFSVVNLMLGIYIKNMNVMIEFYAQKSFIAIYKQNRNKYFNDIVLFLMMIMQ